MTDKQPEALRLADVLVTIAQDGSVSQYETEMAASFELRRLYAVNAALLQALEKAGEALALHAGFSNAFASATDCAIEAAYDAITLAKEQQ